ncbi:MAG: arginase [Spirochaetales bacterium]|nr:arginase [Spirochaetales bacterium]
MRIRLFDVPMDFGANLRGVDMGPTALRRAGLKEALVRLGHTVEEEPRLLRVAIAEHAQPGDPSVRFLDVITQGCRRLAEHVEQACTDGSFPLVLGGDHSIAVGTLAGLSAFHKKKKHSWGTLWIDAHADFNTPETSPSGNVHGMSLAASCGWGHPALKDLYSRGRKLDPANAVVLGARNLDPGEKENLKKAGVKVLTMADIDREGIAAIADQALRYLAGRVDEIHVSFDVDSLDPETAPGVGTPVPGGMTFRELHLLMETLSASGRVTSAEVVEVNPVLDVRNQTARVAVAMIESLLGATIL